MTQEALKLALEALEYASTGNRRLEIIGPAIAAIKEALAQPDQEQETVKWSDYEPDGVHHNKPEQKPVAIVAVDVVGQIQVGWITKPQHNDKLYTTPPQRPRVVFPTMLRKMWSGSEVQAWLDENVNKEKNT